MAALNKSLDASRNVGGASKTVVAAEIRPPPHASPAMQFYSLG